MFGYGSLVSAASVDRTLGRESSAPATLHEAHLDGFGRRWNYGSQLLRGNWRHDGVDVRAGVVVSLGLVAGDESCNGAVFRVSASQLERLDRRESDYDRTDVSHRIRVESAQIDGPVVTYVPRRSAVERYEQARDLGLAAVREEYWDLVHQAFAGMGDDHLEQMSATPRPDVPVVDVELIRPK